MLLSWLASSNLHLNLTLERLLVPGHRNHRSHGKPFRRWNSLADEILKGWESGREQTR